MRNKKGTGDMTTNNKLIVVYGGQYGSEGKGDVCEYITRVELAKEERPIFAIRVGGANAGHSFIDIDGVERVTQQLPVAAFVNLRVIPVLGAGAVIHPGVLEKELLDLARVGGKPVLIDEKAVVTTQDDIDSEAELKTSIGSTGKGVGKTTSDKVMRKATTFGEWINSDCPIAKRIKYWVSVQVCDTTSLLAESSDSVHLLECAQGFRLSLNAVGYYPYCTSRDCGPDAQLSSAGLTTRMYDETDVVCVLRTFPIRVGGNSGPLPNESTWEDLADTYGEHIKPEMTTVTKKVRRVGKWNAAEVQDTIRKTKPNRIFLQFMDYLIPEGDVYKLANAAAEYEQDCLGVPITNLGIGPHQIIPKPKLAPRFGLSFLVLHSKEPEEACESYVQQAMDRVWKSDYPTVDEVMTSVRHTVNERILPLLEQRGRQYGEDVLVEMGETGLVTMLLVKLMRLRWSVENSKPKSERQDSWLDLAGYALLAAALHSKPE
jgi:adenylosuccinate synthase